MFAENKILIDQATILENIIEYEAKRYLEDNNKSRSFIDQFFGKDYRFGISFLWAYTRWLQTQPKADNPNDPKASKPRNDYDWFKSTIELINSWNTKKELEEKETLIFERFISLVQYFQHVDSHLPIDQDAVNQILEDTNNRNLKKEYAIASLLTLEQLKQLLKTKNIVQDGKLILINSHNRTTALFKEGEKYYYFDPSNRIGEVQVDSIDKVAKLIFDTNFYTVSGGTYKIISTKSAYIKPSPLGFRMFSFDEQKAEYPIQKDILDSIDPTLIPEEDYANGCSGLVLAAITGSLESAQYFLNKGVNPNIKSGNNGLTALMWGAYCGHLEVVKALLANQKTDPDIQDQDGRTVLVWASTRGNINIVRELLTHQEVDLNTQSNDGNTALIEAAENGHIEVIRELMSYKNIDPNRQNVGGFTAIMRADNPEIIKELLSHPNIDPNTKNEGGTALIWASFWDNTGAVRVLLENQKTDPNIQDIHGSTALMWASTRDNIDVVTTLLTDKKTDLNIRDEDGRTALITASRGGYSDVVMALLANKNTDLNICDRDGRTAIIAASRNGYSDIVKALLASQNIDLNIQDKDGMTAIMKATEKYRFYPLWSTENSYLEIVKALLARKDIDLSARTKKTGQTVFNLAKSDETKQLLQKYKS